MSWVAVGVGGGALIGGYLQYEGQQSAGRAAQSAAGAQNLMSREQRQYILDAADRLDKEANALAQASPEELNALSRSYQAASAGLAREERLFQAIDPVLMEASQQALKLLKGENTDISSGMMSLRNSQRQELVNTLRSQYGPGAESSSIGQRALRQFDLETNSMRQEAFNQVFNVATNPAARANYNTAISGLQQVGQGYSALQERKLNTRINTGNAWLGALSGTSQQMIQNAGAPYVGQALQGQAQAQMGQSLVNLGGQLGTAYLMRGPQNSTYINNQQARPYDYSMTTDQLGR